MNIKTDQEYITYSRITKHYDLIATTEADDIEVGVDKWWLESESDGDDADYEIEKMDEVKKNFTEDEWDELLEYITELR